MEKVTHHPNNRAAGVPKEPEADSRGITAVGARGNGKPPLQYAVCLENSSPKALFGEAIVFHILSRTVFRREPQVVAVRCASTNIGPKEKLVT